MKVLILLIITIVLAVILVADVQAQCDGPTPSGPTPWPAGGSEKAAGIPAMCPVVREAVGFSQG